MDDFVDVKLEIFIPTGHVDALRQALGRAGIGRIGNYDYCCAVMDARGYWRPLAGANPYQGRIGQVEQGDECKLEVSCPRTQVREVLQVIRSVHPYEQPVINIIPLANHLFEG